MDRRFDLVVVGGGAGGLTAAREARRRGAHVALVQEGPLGGECTFTGCIPSKALLAMAARGAGFEEALTAVRAAVARVAATEDAATLRGEGVVVVPGRATLRAPALVEVDGALLRSPRIVLATGAAPAVPPVEGLAAASPLTTDDVFDLGSLPPRLAVLGGGAVGCELAQAFARLGAAVTLVEAGDRLLDGEEPETSAAVAAALGDDGVDVRVGLRATTVEAASPGRATSLRLSDGARIEVDRVLVATGRTPRTAGMGLEEAGVELDERGFVRTDTSLATTADGVWAVGDVTGRLDLTHAAAQMARVAVRNALSPWARLRRDRFDAGSIPWGVFTDPEVGRVGRTEAQAAELGGRVAFVPLEEVDRGMATGATRGFVKLVAGPRRVLGDAGGGRVLGATVVAPGGAEIVHEVALAMRTRMFTGRLAQATHAYPTWSLAVQQAAAMLFMEVGGRRARPARP